MTTDAPVVAQQAPAGPAVPPPHAADVAALSRSFDDRSCLDLARCRELAAAGSPAANFQLGAWYYLGSRLPRDPDAALRHFRMAAEQGEVRAQHLLGLAYMTGDMVAPDRAEGGRWLMAAAEGGFQPASQMLGHFGFATNRATAQAEPAAIMTPTTLSATADIGGAALDPVALFEAVEPSVWTVLAAKRLRGGIAERSGSAVAVTGHWLFTNCHVVGGADFILIKRGERVEPARLIHANDSTDRCVLETQATLNPVRRIAPYGGLKVGQTVYSIGSPAGLENTLGPGLVTGLRQWQGVPIIQTNAPISPGSSGGALFDAQGHLIGITTFTVGGNGSLGFAVSAESFIQSMLPDARG
ncbi:MAG: trypsin-like peptidase domain-containing protein [Sneathiellaceae bacterium]